LLIEPANLVGIWCRIGGGWNSFQLVFRLDGLGRAEFTNCMLVNA
jgi:hypothetical protein